MMKESNISKTRRGFIKKVAYIAPAIVALGGLNLSASDSSTSSGLYVVDGNEGPIYTGDIPPNDPGFGTFIR